MSGHCYPDGGSLLDQPLLLLDAFSVIGTAKVELKQDAPPDSPD